MNNLKITIPVFIVLTGLLLTFTSCQEDSLLDEQEIISQEATAPFGQDLTNISNPTRGGSTDVDVDLMYVKWQPWVLELRKAEIRAEFSDPNGEVYLLEYTVCQLDNSIERWAIRWNPSVPPKDRTPDPLIILSDHEGEMENDRHITFPSYCP